MPTGYTAKVRDSDDYTFEEFVWDCARAFGALMHMHDSRQDKITKRSDDTYYKENKEGLEKAQKRLRELETISLADAQKNARKNYESLLANKQQGIEREKNYKEKYIKMLEKVRDWKPPTEEHGELKKFMVQQLSDSISFDCSDYYENMKVELLSSDQWIAKEKEKALEDIKYHAEHLEKKSRNNREANEWIDQLNESVPIPEHLKGW